MNSIDYPYQQHSPQENLFELNLPQDSIEQQNPVEEYPIIPLHHTFDIEYFIPKNVKYIGQMFDDLPDNCILNKGSLGCGGTHLALSNDINYVIAVPYISIGESKTVKEYKHEVLFVKSGVNARDIEKYLHRNYGRIKKIIVTYDALERITNLVEVEDFKLLVDEFHSLLINYDFRNRAVKSVLRNLRKYRNIVLMSATPITRSDFELIELRGIRHVNFKWEEPKTVDLYLKNCVYSVEACIVNLIKDFLERDKEENFYIYVNSVEFISKVIDHPDLINVLNDNNCKIVYSKDSSKELRLFRSSINSLGNTKVNFITSTAFEGADIYDVDGRTIVAVDASVDHMKLDISSTLFQITGRIRNAKNTSIELYCKLSNENTVDFETYKLVLNEEVEKIAKYLSALNSVKSQLNDENLNIEFKDFRTFILNNGKEYSFDLNYQPYKLWKYNLSNSIYQSLDSLKNSILNFSYFNFKKIEFLNDKNSSDSRRNYRPSLLKVVKELKSILHFEDKYVKLVNYGTSNKSRLSSKELLYIKNAEEKFPFIWDALKYIGAVQMEQLKFNTRNIKSRVIQFQPLNNAQKIASLLIEMKLLGKTLPVNECKMKLNHIYVKLKIKAKASGNDMLNYFVAEECTRVIKGKRVRCLSIIEQKIILEESQLN